MKLWMLGGLLLAMAGCDDDRPPRKQAEPVAVAAEVAAPTEAEKQAALAKAAEAQAALEKTVQEQTARAPAEARDEAQRTAGILGQAALQGGTFAALTGTGDISSGFDDADVMGGLLGNEEGEMQGGFGFGRSGFGPGGGGTGWGTIGTGRYGTLAGPDSGTGSGYGTGSGRGGMRGRTAAVPQMRLGQPSCTGDLDKAIVRRYIKRQAPKLTYCYEKQLLARPGLEGTVSTQFRISENGVVSGASASGVDREVSSCIAAVLDAMELPKPKSGEAVNCSYPLSFRPTGG